MANLQVFTKMAHQVGGHSTSNTSLKAQNGRILKPFQSNQRGKRESDFYERVFSAKETLYDYAGLRIFLPEYYGTIVVPEAENGQDFVRRRYLVLEDLTWGRQWPCIMDVKMGTRSYEHNAPIEKIAYEKSKFPLQEKVGLRIQGMKVYQHTKKGYVEFDKSFGRGIVSLEQLVYAFRCYFPADDTTKKIALLQTFLHRLGQIKEWFDEQQSTEFIASSFLFLYDGDMSSANGSKADIRLIDFAHVTMPVSPKRDEGLRTGIATLISSFQTLLHEARTKQDCSINCAEAPDAS